MATLARSDIPTPKLICTNLREKESAKTSIQKMKRKFWTELRIIPQAHMKMPESDGFPAKAGRHPLFRQAAGFENRQKGR
jgi:hypothetical protein